MEPPPFPLRAKVHTRFTLWKVEVVFQQRFSHWLRGSVGFSTYIFPPSRNISFWQKRLVLDSSVVCCSARRRPCGTSKTPRLPGKSRWHASCCAAASRLGPSRTAASHVPKRPESEFGFLNPTKSGYHMTVCPSSLFKQPRRECPFPKAALLSSSGPTKIAGIGPMRAVNVSVLNWRCERPRFLLISNFACVMRVIPG